MFTGLIADRGHVASVDADERGSRLTVSTPLAVSLASGDSIAVNGVCLTAAAVDGSQFAADVMLESLRASSLAGLRAGSAVNLELPLRAQDRLGGHVVQGHVDGVGRVARVTPDGVATVLFVEADPTLLRYVVVKGSIAVDGVSLTVASLDERSFAVSLIPETIARTNLGDARPGQAVNLEVDVLAKYVERLIPSAVTAAACGVATTMATAPAEARA